MSGAAAKGGAVGCSTIHRTCVVWPGRIVVTNANVATTTGMDRFVAGLCSWRGLGRVLQQVPRCASAAHQGTVGILDTQAGR